MQPSEDESALSRRMRMHAPALRFREDIEGLRAVAIVLVVATHAGVPWLTGGFVGVDVFFVLSGFLITALLLAELEETGGIRLRAFYARRLQRLFPALLVVIAATCLASSVLLAPLEQHRIVASAASATAWVSNFHFAFSQLDYFGTRAETNPFLHTWSLGVEEQFYLAWPALVLLLLGAWGWQGCRLMHRRLFWGLGVIFVAGFALSVLLTYTAPRLGFYMVHSRAWQFALGALVLLATRRSHGKHWTAPAWIGWLGLAGIIASAWLLDGNTPYPGIMALAPSLATALVIWSGSAPRHVHGVGRLLSVRPMQAIGRVSYVWYLWHWPVFLLGSTVIGARQPWNMFVLVIVSLALAWITHALIETPIRNAGKLRARPLAVLAASAMAMLAFLTAAQWWQAATQRWLQMPEQRRIAAVRGDVPIIYPNGCDEWYRSNRVKTCWFGKPDAPKTAVLLGDSMVGQWFPALAPLARDPDWRILVITKSACAMVDVPFFYERIRRRYTECEGWRRDALALLQDMKPDLVVSGSSSSYPFSSRQWIEGSERIFSRLASAAGRVVILQSTPILPFDAPTCLAREAWRPALMRRRAVCSSSAEQDGEQSVRGAINQAARGFPNIQVLDFSSDVCPDERCRATLDGIPVFRDSQHLSSTFVAQLAPRFLERLDVGRQAQTLAGTPHGSNRHAE